MVTGFGLPAIAGCMAAWSGRRVNKGVLVLVGQMIVSILLPCLATVSLHSECIGMWTKFWAPCRDSGFQFGAVPEGVGNVDGAVVNLVGGFEGHPLVLAKTFFTNEWRS
eukprot:5707340-Amphidinium_carterae.1